MVNLNALIEQLTGLRSSDPVRGELEVLAGSSDGEDDKRVQGVEIYKDTEGEWVVLNLA